MKPTIGEDLTPQDKRDKIRSQLYYELGLPEQIPNKNIKSKGGVCKRESFLVKSQKQKKEDPTGL